MTHLDGLEQHFDPETEILTIKVHRKLLSTPASNEEIVEAVAMILKGRQQRPNVGERRDLIGEANPDTVPAGTPGAAENICRRCSGSGEIDGRPCPDCGGSGKVVTPVGGGG